MEYLDPLKLDRTLRRTATEWVRWSRRLRDGQVAPLAAFELQRWALGKSCFGQLRELLAGRVSAFSGPSGAGKSSLVNRIEPGLDLRVGATSEAHGKGRHTTRVATLHPLTGGGFIADTPGIRELASFEIPAPQLAACFREFRPFLGQCTYRSCKHLTEPGCAILAAVESEDIDSDRYESFAKLLLGEERPDRVG